MRARHADILDQIATTGALPKEADLEAAIEEFKRGFGSRGRVAGTAGCRPAAAETRPSTGRRPRPGPSSHMAGGQERILRRRIRTIEATKKITRSFELIAASQISRAQGRIAGSRPVCEGDLGHPGRDRPREPAAPRACWRIPESPQNVLVLVIVADRGLAGAYNSSVLRAAERLHPLRVGRRAESYRVMAVGKKAQAYFRFRHQPVERQFVGMSDRPSFEDARRVAAAIVPAFPRRRGRPRADRLDPDAFGEHASSSRRASCFPSCRARGPGTTDAALGTSREPSRRRRRPSAEPGVSRGDSSAISSSSPTSSTCCSASSPSTPRRPSTPPCSRPPRRSTPPANGRCRQPPRTPKSC